MTLKDPRSVASLIAITLGVVGYVALSALGHSADANKLIPVISTPLAFIIGLGSEPKTKDD